MRSSGEVAPDAASSRQAGVAPDGSPVEVYRLLPAMGEPELIHAAVPGGATILELGCGAGRVTAGLVALGHAVTGVDESPAMLEAAAVRAPDARFVQARLEDLDLGEQFDAVVLASHLVNDEAHQRSAYLAAAKRHVAPTGSLLVEAYPPGTEWPGSIGQPHDIGAVRMTVTRAIVDGSRLTACVRYEVPGASWDQPFEAELLDEAGLRATLADAGFAFERWLDPRRGWLLARPT